MTGLTAGLPALGQAVAPGGGYALGGSSGVSPTAANPLMSLVLTGNYADFSSLQPFKVPGFALGPDTAPGRPGFQLGESELSVYGNIDPYLFGWAVLSFAPEGSVNVEEAFIQTTSLPLGFLVKAGRFHSSIGYMNVLHRHADDFIDTPLVYTAFLNGQLADDGLQLRWLAPTDVFLQFGGEFFNGAAYPASGSGNRGRGTNTQFINVADDVGEGGSYLLGLSHVDSQATRRLTADEDPARVLSFTGSTSLNILSLVFKWSPLGNVRETQLKLQTEYFSGDETGTYTKQVDTGLADVLGNAILAPVAVDATGANRISRSGWYAQAVFKFQQRWRVGLRYSEVAAALPKDPNAAGTDLDPRGRTPSIGSAMLEFWPTEFSQLRVQYSQDSTDPQRSVDRWYLQYIVTLGAHAAHAY